jgi:hypothetical protein
VAEKKGRVWVVAANGAVLRSPLLDIRAKVNDVSDRGLLGIAADKDFESNGYRTYDERTLAGKVIRIDRQGRGLAQHPFCPGSSASRSTPATT